MRAALTSLAALALCGCGTYYREVSADGASKTFVTFQDHGYGYRDTDNRGGTLSPGGGAGNVVSVGRTLEAYPVQGAGLSVGGEDGMVITGPSSTSAPAREVGVWVATWARIKGIFGLGKVITEEVGDTARVVSDDLSD